MMGSGEAASALESGTLTGDLVEFYREVVNVLSRLLNSPSTPHVVLADVFEAPGQVPADVASVALEPAVRYDYRVSIDSYGAGAMTLLAR
jgi:hypothetical protein